MAGQPSISIISPMERPRGKPQGGVLGLGVQERASQAWHTQQVKEQSERTESESGVAEKH